jgi:ubiquinone/menaquinone biosynthesis C-methylase UbiE
VIDTVSRTPTSQDELVRRSFAYAKEYARLYDGSTQCARFFQERLRQVVDLVAPAKNGRILDVGCGPGVLLTRLGVGQFQLFGLDRSQEMITEAKARTAAFTSNLTVGRLEQLPFRSASFDGIVAVGVLEYLPELKLSLKEIARLAKPNAFVLVSMLNRLSLYRLWERFIYKRWRGLRRDRGMELEPVLFLRGQRSLMRMMEACQLEPIDVAYYGLNVCLPPFDAKYPRHALALNRWVEAHCGRWFLRALHTGFILKARRK